jgi:transglutaminase-like putative cysteine protease
VKIRILYEAEYRYDEPVGFSPHLFRLFPRPDRHLTVSKCEFETNTGAAVRFRRDLFDNEIASCFYPEPAPALTARLSLDVELRERNAYDFLLASHAVDFPFHYEPHEALVLAPYLQKANAQPLSFWHAPASGEPTVTALTGLNHAIYQNLKYEWRDEGPARGSKQTLELGRGSCRDFAVLMAETLRGLGVAARLASGYLRATAENQRFEGAMHAWVEAYLPGAGWVGFDPTNGTLCSTDHLTAAVGLSPEDVTPILGRYAHPHKVESRMNASLRIVPV